MEQAFNRQRINMISWLSYFFTGALVSTLGIVIGPVSQAFGKDPGFIGQMFTLMNIGLFLPIMVSGVLMRKFNPGKQLITGSAVSVLACIALFLMPTITMFGIGVFLIGASSGIMMSIGSYLVVRINEDPKKRSANLILTDFFFALAGVVLSLLLGYLFQHGASWLAMYGVMAVLSLAMIVLCVGQTFPSIPQAAQTTMATETEVTRWGMSVWVLCFALFAFLLAEPIFTMWLPSWLKAHFGMAADRAAFYITTYWTVKSIGLFVNQFTVRFVKLRTYLLLSAFVGLMCLAVAANSADPMLILVCAGLFGFCNSGLFSGIMSYGSLQVSNSPPTLTSALLTLGTLGTLIFSTLSSLVYSRYGLFWALNSATVAYVFLLLALIFAAVNSKAEALEQQPAR
ncbi:MFS transporter TsgA [Rahnella sp. C60]|uniref:MFS transporter TsgA n=1 Tax=Rahnella TaxID=34037 RepID=UPI0010225D52|nr:MULTISPECIES: MFS transporter TsgA [Rahnella]MBU9810206.1 MFS transporter TsgA [Rahnella perminowiae]MBU9815158.1 MFS transporter TsgA [Rahnella perminowiae]MBU9827456.1 MFS transporter TsgA [Rahnella perminowiae]UJD88591.1 MFS transporter TsgA [Rahnella aquatilis]